MPFRPAVGILVSWKIGIKGQTWDMLSSPGSEVGTAGQGDQATRTREGPVPAPEDVMSYRKDGLAGTGELS